MFRSIFTSLVWPLTLITAASLLISASSPPDGGEAAAWPLTAGEAQAPLPPTEVRFMREFIARINPSLTVEDAACAEDLPRAIHAEASAHGVAWARLLALAWQESDFDCHAKNLRDKGGAYGAFQIRRLWEPVIGDPRRDYFDPNLAAARAAKVLVYYRETERHRDLVARRFRNPTLCLYNTGERLAVNMRYCRTVGVKLRLIEEAWRKFQERSLAEGGGTAAPRNET